MTQLLGYLAFVLFFSFINCNAVIQDCPQQGKGYVPSNRDETPPTVPSPISQPDNGATLGTSLVGADSKGYLRTPLICGYGGDHFDDEIPKNEVMRIKSLTVQYGDLLNGIITTYVKSNGDTFVKKNLNIVAQSTIIDLGDDDVITRIEVITNDNLVGQIEFFVQNTVTMETSNYGPYGKGKGDKFYFNGHVVGFYGRLGDVVDGLGFYYIETAVKGPAFGGSGGKHWEDPVLTNSSPIFNIDSITIWHGQSIDAIQANYTTLGGGHYQGDKHGGSGGNPPYTINLEPGEYLVQIETMSSENLLGQVNFTTKKESGETTKYGPYGSSAYDHSFSSVVGRIIGFYGGEGDVLDSLGVFLAEENV